MITIAYVRDTDALTDLQVAAYVMAQQVQISRDFYPAWGIDAHCVFVPPSGSIPVSTVDNPVYQLWFKDHSDQAGALGYHDVNGNPIAYVFVKDDIADGVTPSVTGSHETLEMLADPEINQVVDAMGNEYAREVCDACEDEQFAYMIDGVLMSDFMLPSWFNLAGTAPFTHQNAVTVPFGLAAGGYIGQRSLPDGQWVQRFAETTPSSPRQIKKATSRTMRRFMKS